MYFPYLRGKEFELSALLEVNASVYSNTIPILEPVTNKDRRKQYEKIGKANLPLVLITNPSHGDITAKEIQDKIDKCFITHSRLTLGYIVDTRFSIKQLTTFLKNNPKRDKAIIFRHNPLASDLAAIETALSASPAKFLIFDTKRTNTTTQSILPSHKGKVLITDGFERQDKNDDYPPISNFDSIYKTWKRKGILGIGDYLTIGDYFSKGGGQVFVVALHVTIEKPTGLEVHHFKSNSFKSTKGLAPQKFKEANNLLSTSSHVIPLTSSGILLYKNWDAIAHFPALGAAKKASIMHHIELMSKLVV